MTSVLFANARSRPTRALLLAIVVGASLASRGSAATPRTEPLYVSPSGSTVGTCTQAAPCAGFDRAYRVARPGQVVQIAAGTYPSQSIGADSTKANATQNVVFRPASGATVTIGSLAVSGAHVELHGLRMDLTRCVNVQIEPPCPSLSIKTGAHDVLIDDIRASRFFITGAYNIRIQNSDFGPSYDVHGIIHADTARNRPHDIVLSNVSVHDHWNTDACKATPGCLSQHHQGCGPTLNDAYNVLEDRMRFFNCQNLGQLIKPYRFANENITIQNSWFGASNGFYSLDLTSNKSRPNQGLHIRNNTFTKGIAVSRGISYPNSVLAGNILASLSCSTFLNAGWTVASNVLRGSTPCGIRARAVPDLGLAADGYHLGPRSPALGAADLQGAPLTDIDGHARPRRWRPDAGADQREPAALVLGRSIGAVSLGMREAEVVAFYGNPAARKPRAGTVRDSRMTFASYRLYGGWLTVSYAGNQVVGLATTSPYYATDSGLGVRSKTRALRNLPWLKCRQAYRRRMNGVQVYFKVSGGRSGKAIAGVSMVKPRFRQC